MFLPRLVVPSVYGAVTPVSCNGPHPVSSCLDLAVNSNTVNIGMLTPTINGSFAYASSTVNVRTNAPGYQLSLSGLSPDTPSLINTSPSANGAAIIPVPNDYAPLAPGTWGYTLWDNSTAIENVWSIVPGASSAVTIISGGSSNESIGSNTTVYYGVNISSSQPTGTYTTQVRYSAIANSFPAPTIASVSSNSSSTAGGNTITITGTNFYDTTPTSGVKIGNNNCTSFTVVSPTQITCIVPANSTAGSYNVTVETNGGTAIKTNGYTYVAPAIVTGIAPSANLVNGNTVTISGTGFTNSLGVYSVSDNSPYTACTINSATNITCPVSGIPEGGTGTITVTITGIGGTATTSFTYNQPHVAPTITGISHSISTAYGTTTGTIYVSTDRPAYCGWNLNADVVWGVAVYGFDASQYWGTTWHSAGVYGMSGGYNAIYVRCINIHDSSKISGAAATAVSIDTTPPYLVSGTAMQSATAAQCAATTPGSIVNLTDARDGKVYQVKKMNDGRCWMIDNLSYDIGTASGRPAYNPAPALISGTTASTRNRAQYVLNSGYTNISGHTNYLYNWCAALGDTSTNCTSSRNAGTYQTVISGVINAGNATWQPDVTGICPAPFRLPKGGPAATGSNPDTTANEFAKLHIAMGGTGANSTHTNTYYQFLGTAGTGDNWHGILSGYYLGGDGGLLGRNDWGRWWSSTAENGNRGYYLRVRSNAVQVYPDDGSNKDNAFPLRCIL